MIAPPTVAYDANGNTLTDAQGRSFTWDFENRLTQAVVPGANGGTTTFRYDPFGRRIQKSGPLGTTNYLYDGANIVEEIDGGGSVLAKFAQGSHVDEWLAELQAGGTSYYEEDGVDSVSSLSNLSGALANTYTFDSFGKLTGSTGTFVNPFQYTSREFDPETGIYFYRARYYDQSAGRFISEDPIGFGAGTHFYKYARNNPVLLNDPFGLWVSTGTPAPPDTNTIVCNGLGGIMVQIGINQDLPCGLATCIWEHEERHWKDAIAANPGVCHLAPAGTQVTFSNGQERTSSEYAASTVELQCLTYAKNHAGCDHCKQVINDRIHVVRQYRSQFQ